MKQIYFLFFILMGLVAYVVSFFLAPSILSPPPATKVICETFPLARLTDPYLSCLPDEAIKIQSAHLITTDQSTCPLQFIENQKPAYCPSGQGKGKDITVEFQTLCNNKQDCYFFFGQLPGFTDCDASFRQGISVTYNCLTNRKRFRPFANKRYDWKFTRTANHPFRKLSYNHLTTL